MIQRMTVYVIQRMIVHGDDSAWTEMVGRSMRKRNIQRLDLDAYGTTGLYVTKGEE